MQKIRKNFRFNQKDVKKWQKYADKFHNGNLTAAICYLMNRAVEKLGN